jgi:HD-GYP domain-containing protein (c-di-GMP phosphodiesterase class II)
VGAEALLKRPDELDEDERGALALHPETGAQLARGAGVPEEVCNWLRSWTEHFDGSGPGGLAGTRIPLESRLIHAGCRCDAALVAPSAAARRETAAAAQLRGLAGAVLDPDAAEALAAILDRSAAGY